MNKRSPEFNRYRLKVEPIEKRNNNLVLSDILPLKAHDSVQPTFRAVASKIHAAKASNSAIILMMGAHVLRSGVQRYLVDLMERGYLSCIAVNGAGVIHDFEFAFIGATTESVSNYIREGQFGLWQETGRINDIVSTAANQKIGLGEAVGQVIEEEQFSYRDISILAAGYRLGIPITVHIGIGYDIVHQFPNCDGAAYGSTSYADFLKFTKVMESLEGGVVMNFGSAVMSPEIYLKALSMVRNVARQEKRQICHFTTFVCDLADLPDNYREEALTDNPLYYFRPWKTMLVRTVADGGESFYVRGCHTETIPQLWTAVTSYNREGPRNKT
ncbi:MAG: hypothetical protein C4549_03865 [Deltaproteobacteria bacterium]|jgi:hypothetical protein|nr:MAG: hypothetical protein C4549_03865 [Deltaproteobacteria bacterium]